jgi:hypothetical protein
MGWRLQARAVANAAGVMTPAAWSRQAPKP